MNKFILPTAILLTLFLSAITVVFAVDKRDSIIVEKAGDISGDRKEDNITITGSIFGGGAEILKDIRLLVDTSEGKSFEKKLKDGYKPQVFLNDLNHDGNEDVLIKVHVDDQGNEANYFLYSLLEADIVELDVPAPLAIRSQYEDDYQVSLKIDKANEAYTFNFTGLKEEYDQLGLYRNGKLNEPMELVVSSFQSLKPVQLKDGQQGLKGIQTLSGVLDGTPVGTLESSWVLKNEVWELVDTSIQSPFDLTKE